MLVGIRKIMKAKIALITGGYTDEYEISIKSADFVFQELDQSVYDVYKVFIEREEWYHLTEEGRRIGINRNDFSLEIDGQKVVFDLAFVMLHGSPGEDGRLQGYFDMIGLAYTTCDPLTSALTMNKTYTKSLLRDIPGLYLAKSVLLSPSDREKGADIVCSQLQMPCFVKPNAGGSSLGMSKVTMIDQLPAALEKAFDEVNTGQQVIVEEFIQGREFTVGVYTKADGSLNVLPDTEVIPSREFFDYESKYTPGLTREITPGNLNVDQRRRVERLVKEIYVRLNCRGMVRIDYFLENGTDHFYFVEVNTVPGQTAQSFIPQQVRAAGLTESAFYGELIEVALGNRS